jgi:hypothetical protein
LFVLNGDPKVADMSGLSTVNTREFSEVNRKARSAPSLREGASRYAFGDAPQVTAINAHLGYWNWPGLPL